MPAHVACRFEQLHQGLYLGFGSLRSMSSPRLYELWHTPELDATVFYNSSDYTQGTNETMSLFNLGDLFTSAARDVQYAALHPDSNQAQGGPLSHNRQWMFLQANGPEVLHHAYLTSLNYMVSLANQCAAHRFLQQLFRAWMSDAPLFTLSASN